MIFWTSYRFQIKTVILTGRQILRYTDQFGLHSYWSVYRGTVRLLAFDIEKRERDDMINSVCSLRKIEAIQMLQPYTVQ